jgi:hypothetical protein
MNMDPELGEADPGGLGACPQNYPESSLLTVIELLEHRPDSAKAALGVCFAKTSDQVRGKEKPRSDKRNARACLRHA